MTEASNILRVDCVVLTMRTDEPDVDDTIWIIDPDHDSILVAGNIKDGTAVLENAGAADIPFDFRRLRPIGLFHLPKPRHYRLASIGNACASVKKGLDRAKRYHPHWRTVARSQFGT